MSPKSKLFLLLLPLLLSILTPLSLSAQVQEAAVVVDGMD